MFDLKSSSDWKEIILSVHYNFLSLLGNREFPNLLAGHQQGYNYQQLANKSVRVPTKASIHLHSTHPALFSSNPIESSIKCESNIMLPEVPHLATNQIDQMILNANNLWGTETNVMSLWTKSSTSRIPVSPEVLYHTTHFSHMQNLADPMMALPIALGNGQLLTSNTFSVPPSLYMASEASKGYNFTHYLLPALTPSIHCVQNASSYHNEVNTCSATNQFMQLENGQNEPYEEANDFKIKRHETGMTPTISPTC